MTRLLVVGHGGRPTGYARVMESVLRLLAARGSVEPVLFALDVRGPAPPARPYVLRANRLPGDRYGREQLPALLAEVEPDIVLVHGDSQLHLVHAPVLERWRDARPGRAVAVWCPLDWGVAAERLARALARANLVATYTEHGRAALERSFAAAGVAAPPLAVVGHGVDTDRFRPLGGAPVRGDDREFTVLNANRNVSRKRIDLTLHGFALFARDRPKARLCLHMAERGGGADVPALAAELAIADRVECTGRGEDHPAWEDERLAALYAACDVGVNTCEAEGWGMPSFEHAAAGAAQVVPDAGACGELWRGAALLLPARATERGGHEVAPDSLASALAVLHDDADARADMAARARARALETRFGWDAVATQWEALVQGLARDRYPAREAPELAGSVGAPPSPWEA